MRWPWQRHDPFALSPWGWLVGWCVEAWTMCVLVPYCQRHGHRWGRGGLGFDGESTIHWAECSRCGHSETD